MSSRPNPAVQSEPSPASVSSVSSSLSKRTATASPRAAPDAAEPPPKKVQKVSRACDHCKAKKLKCTGNIPCAGCTKRGLECHYEASYRRGRPPTPPPAPGARARDQQGTGATAGPSRTSDSATTGQQTPAIPTSRASPELESSEIGGQYIDPTSNLTFLHRAWKRLSAQGRSTSTSDPLQPITAAGDRPFTLPPSTSDSAIFLPDRSTAQDLIAYYFSTCVVTYRCLHQPTVTAWLDILLSNAETGFPLTHRLGNARVSVVLCVFAIALLRRGKIASAAAAGSGAGSPDDADQARAHAASDQYFLQASGLSSRDVGLPGLEAAQARILQVLFLLQSSRMNQAWYIFGGTLPIVSALGLHRKPGRKLVAGAKGGDYIAAQCRKRTFWVAYIIDKYLAVVFGRPRLYHDDDIDQDFPDRVNDEDMTAQGPSGVEPKVNCHMDSTIAHAQLAQIIGNISREGYSLKPMSRRQRLDASHRFRIALRNWYSTLPAHLGPAIRPLTLTPLFRRQHTALKLAYCHAIMHASRPFLLGRDAVDDAVREAIRECIAAAKSSLETVDAIVSDGSAFWAYWWTPYVTFCALAVVYVWEIQRQGAPVPQEDAPPGLFELAERCQSHLANSTEHGSLGWRYNVILEELRLEARRQALGEAEMDVPAFVQADMSTFAIPPVHGGGGGGGGGSAAAAGSSSNNNNMYSSIGAGAGMLDEWQPADWLDIDSSAFGPYPEFDSTMMWGFGEGGI